MLAYTYVKKGQFVLTEKAVPQLENPHYYWCDKISLVLNLIK